MKTLLILFVMMITTLNASDWYASPTGLTVDEGGTGTFSNPWTLGIALKGANGAVKPGDTLWVRGGTYRGRYASTLTGTAALPIKVKVPFGERAVIEGFIETFTATLIPSAPAGSNTNFFINGGGEGFSGNLPNNNMKVNLSYLPPGSTTAVEEVMLMFGADRDRMWVQRAACPGGTCPSFPVGTSVRGNAEYLKTGGAYTWFMGLEVQYTQDTHVYGAGATNPPWPNFQGAVLDRCNGCKFINMAVRDSGANGFFSSPTAQGTEIYGNLVFYNGVDQLGNRGHGHGVYAQNTDNGPDKTIEHNVFMRSFGHGNQIYGSSASWLDNFKVIGNVFFNAGEPAGGTRGGTHFVIGDAGVFTGHIFKDNMSYGVKNVDIGYGGSASAPECTSPSITGNYLINRTNGLVLKVTCKTPTITGNTLYGSISGFNRGTYSNNTYLSNLSGQRIFVLPNRYELGRGWIVVYNWSNLGFATINVSSVGLVNGDRFKVVDLQNYDGLPVLQGTYNGAPIVLPLTNTAVTQPFGTIAVPPIVHTPAEFNVFLIVKE